MALTESGISYFTFMFLTYSTLLFTIAYAIGYEAGKKRR